MGDPLHNIGLKQIRKLLPIKIDASLDDDFFVIDYSSRDKLDFLKYPCRSDAYMAIFCKAGKLEVEMNLHSYTLTASTLFIGSPGLIMKLIEPPQEELQNLQVIVLAISKEFLSSVSVDVNKIFHDRMTLLSDPCVELDDSGLSFCAKYLDLVTGMLNSDFPNKRESVGALVASLFYFFAGFMQKMDPESRKRPAKAESSSTRVKLLFEHFMSLVTEYHGTERGVAFYADRIGLTPKYLSKLIRQVSGRSAPDWIDSFVILEAKNLLKYSDDSIKQIVSRLHFPNPSVFYKFFKAHTGMTPNEYRNH